MPDRGAGSPERGGQGHEDRSLPIAKQNRLIAEAEALTPDNPYDVHTLNTSHVGFLFRAPEVATILDKLSV